VIVLLKEKFNQYNNFYITDTESLSVEQISNLRRTCFNKQVEMKVAKNTLIRKALESLDSEKYAGLFDSLNNVTALMFSENPKDPAVIISAFRKVNNGDRPTLKAAFINGDIFVGDNSLVALTNIKTKNELIGEVIGLLQSPAKRVIAALLNHAENGSTKTETEVVAAAVEVAVEEVAAPVAEAAPAEAPVAEAPAAEAAPEAAAE
jgi:large subunit ribosomal protein L10